MSMGLGEISSGIVVLFMFILGVLLTKHYLANRRIYMFWWAIAFWLAFLAAITDFISYLAHGWSPFQYRLYLFSAASLVAYMGAGTVFLFSERVGRIYVLLMTVVAMAMCYSLAIIPVEGISTIPAGEKAQGFVPNGIDVYFGILSGIGAIALFVGALYSWYRSKKSYNLWIAMGALSWRNSADSVRSACSGVITTSVRCRTCSDNKFNPFPAIKITPRLKAFPLDKAMTFKVQLQQSLFIR